MPKRTKKVKARIAWAPYADDPRFIHMGLSNYNAPDTTRVAVIPLTAADYDAMVEQMGRELRKPTRAGIFTWSMESQSDALMRAYARAALRAIGITRPKEDKP